MPLLRTSFVLAIVAVLSVPADQPVGAVQDSGVRMVAVEGEGAKYWSRWRGPSGQGLAVGTGFPMRWSATENVKWKVTVPGAGNSSPIVWGDRIFLTTSYNRGAKLSVLAFNRTTGARLWEVFAPSHAGWAHAKNGHASATAVTDGVRVYASFGNSLVAVDLNGKIVWNQDVGQISNYHGPAGSPLLYRDRLILFQDHGSGSFIAAFDLTTGRQLWRTPRDASVGWGTPVAVRVGNRDEIIVNGQSRVQAYDPSTGRELWTARGTTMEVIPTPVVGHGLVFCASGRAGPTLAIRPGGQGDVTRSHVSWTSPRGSPFVPSPILIGSQLYTVNDMASIVTSFDAATGRTLWQGRLGVARREGFSASPVAADDHVFFTNDDGETFVLKAGPTFELVGVNQLGESVLASPALVDGRWYFRTSSHLVAIGR